jgi:hypothetical protein
VCVCVCVCVRARNKHHWERTLARLIAEMSRVRSLSTDPRGCDRKWRRRSGKKNETVIKRPRGWTALGGGAACVATAQRDQRKKAMSEAARAE